MNTLRERIHQAMTDAHLSQAQLARACGVSAPSVNDWLSGKTKTLKGSTAVRAAACLGVSPLWLTEGRGPQKERSVSEPQTPYVNTLSTERERTIAEIVDLLKTMGDRGLAVVLDKAKDMAKEYPKAINKMAG